LSESPYPHKSHRSSVACEVRAERRAAKSWLQVGKPWRKVMVGGVDVAEEEEEEQGKRWVEMWMTRPSGKERGMRVAEANHSSAVGGGEEEALVLVAEAMSLLPVL